MTLSKFYVNIEPPQSKKVLWIKPLEDGFALYIWFRDKWLLLKILDDNGTPIIFDDTTLDFYTKEEVDNKLADILGLDAEGVAELKALIEDDDSLTGLLGELNKKANVVLLSDYIDSDNPLPTDCIYKRIVGGSGREFKYLLPKEVKYSEDSYLIFKIPDDTDESFVYTVFKREHRTTTMQYYYNASYNTSTDEVPAWVEDAFGYTRSEIDAKIPESIEDLSDGDRVDNIEKALSESLALYDFSDNQQHAQSPNLLFYYNNPESLIGELNLYWNWPSEVGSQTYYVAWSSGANGNYVYAKKGTITMKIVTYVDRRISSYPDLLIRWGTDTQYHVGAQWPYGEETIYTSSDYQEIETWVVRNITFEVPNDGYLFGFGNVFTQANNMFAVLYINLSSEQLVEVSKKLATLEETLDRSLSEKVDKELGKVLSTNDYTDADKAKVDTLPQTYESKLTFITSSSSSVNAVSNTYCRFTSNPYSNITITLPTNPTVGDVCIFNFITNSSFSDVTWYNGTVKTMKDYTVEKGARNEVTALYDGSGYWLITNVSFTI